MAKTSGARRLRVGPQLILTFASIAAAYLIWQYVGLTVRLNDAERQIEAAEARRARLAAENERLREEARLLETDAYIEQVAREQLGLILRGEVPVFLVEPGAAAPEGTDPTRR